MIGCTVERGHPPASETGWTGPSSPDTYGPLKLYGIMWRHFRMFIHELLNKDIDIVPYSSRLIILDSKSAVCMSMNIKDNKSVDFTNGGAHTLGFS